MPTALDEGRQPGASQRPLDQGGEKYFLTNNKFYLLIAEDFAMLWVLVLPANVNSRRTVGTLQIRIISFIRKT